ncbi:MAG: MBL fold metallo-hydrolase [Candidatus Marinimicrobia bacterium]|nr:MBL fold metallo-hydrolase [Candidatus Neomarinimicrobiota bacterium]
MYFKRIYEEGLAQASYVVGCQAKGIAMVIDPKRDIDTYLEIAEKEDLKITHIAETHIHADFLSGSRELAAATDAEILVSDAGDADWQYQFEHTGLNDGDVFNIGNIKVEVIHTPGHTPEHISFLVTDTPAGDHPNMIFTGDFVFVGDVGRPDLLEEAAGIQGTKESSARDMFDSLKKFKALPDHVQVWPAHGAGSACGKALGAVPGSTVGYEKLVNWALQIEDEDEFVEALLAGQPEPPKYFAMMKKLNKEGAPVLGSIPHPARLTLPQFERKLDNGQLLVDTRDKLSFAGGHIPGSINIQDNGSFSTWAGWTLDYDEPFVLVAEDDRIEELTRKLIRIGLDNIDGYLPGLETWSRTGNELEIGDQITAENLREAIDRDEIHVIDVRQQSEYDEAHIPTAHKIHAGQISDHLDEVPKHKSVALYCEGGDRSSVATSYLMSEGFHNVKNLTGGIRAWCEAGFPVERGEKKAATEKK